MVNSYMERFYEKHKDKIKEVHKCECGGTYVYFGKARHFKTKGHKENIELRRKLRILLKKMIDEGKIEEKIFNEINKPILKKLVNNNKELLT